MARRRFTALSILRFRWTYCGSERPTGTSPISIRLSGVSGVPLLLVPRSDVSLIMKEGGAVVRKIGEPDQTIYIFGGYYRGPLAADSFAFSHTHSWKSSIHRVLSKRDCFRRCKWQVEYRTLRFSLNQYYDFLRFSTRKTPLKLKPRKHRGLCSCFSGGPLPVETPEPKSIVGE